MNKKQAVIFSTAYFPLVGGAEVAMKEITDRLPDWELSLYCAKIHPGLEKTEQWGNVRIYRCGFGHSLDKYLLPFIAAPQAAWRYRKSKPIIWSLLASYGGFAALAYTWIRPQSRLLLTLQEGDPLEHYNKRTGVLQFLHRAIFARANEVHAISNFLGEWAKQMGFIGTPHIIPNGVDMSRFMQRISIDERNRLRAEYGFQEDDIVIITASRLTLKNATDDLIRALPYLPSNYKLLIVGEGEDKKMLDALVAELNVSSRCVFLGLRGHEELPAILQSADIFCRPSLSEGLGISFLEAMAVGLPIIGTPVGGIPDFLKDGETGVFCEPRNPQSIAAAATRIIDQPDLRKKIIAQGEVCVRHGYNWDEIARSVQQLLEKI